MGSRQENIGLHIRHFAFRQGGVIITKEVRKEVEKNRRKREKEEREREERIKKHGLTIVPKMPGEIISRKKSRKRPEPKYDIGSNVKGTRVSHDRPANIMIRRGWPF
ncbi:MAG: hypothetical protein UX87_C0037G0008 [Candidatus Amesbacteria bacterium GW2011_GWA1_47_16]|uniref:Uncharacterized protein n=3 Tax=Candidatus Amesiibacteriota TaxID=1752730 RepID=A0A0G1UT92_9BACT|nr:MAG: hypothetical protein UX87_C0037G0008 [Candidatus Amesbacteria bacterium GW2011_GWA1_47_16]KKU97424.1 MAG: hypothetical protein UY28_C0021G0011 [Candidatus Amesbacteria bacterium GW2011_GWB1_48_13]OGC98738.1 MAG: hypothetical protein A2701_01465 [Candidatus Amesbacteria bacterium RIFCSPHIGHO2_01_FULL_47_34]OGD01482.1 MAG: hypothetical protein A2972_02900 [Candidatus Amesbacteria bacterium RIFCSPLOWO2_01_FULL_47_33]